MRLVADCASTAQRGNEAALRLLVVVSRIVLTAHEDIMPGWTLTSDSESRALAGLAKESDRAAGIIAATFVEDRLTRAIKQRLRQSDARKSLTSILLADIFRPSGPLGTFSTKNKIGYLLGLYQARFYRELELVKDIRNDFAHSLDTATFDTPSIRDRCAHLKIIEQYVIKLDEFRKMPETPWTTGTSNPQKYLSGPKNRYIYTCAQFSTLLNHMHEGSVSPIRGDGDTLP